MLKFVDFVNIPQDQPPEKKNPLGRKSSMTLISKSKMILAPEPSPSERPSQMTINLKIEKPDIILVEHMDSIDTNAIILNVSI